MAYSEKVRHAGRPAEPFATVGMHGVVTRCHEDGPLRITPAYRNIPAMAHIAWEHDSLGIFTTWEKLSDLIFLQTAKPRS